MADFDIIAFDADDTLWHTESLYTEVVNWLRPLLMPYHAGNEAYVGQTMHQIEIDNLRYYGYGIKGFALSLIEAAIEISAGRIQGDHLKQVIDLAKRMLTAEVHFVEHAEETIASLAGSYPLMLITKGDLFEQETKIARSGLQAYFSYIEIVSDKTRDAYHAVLSKHGFVPERFLMVGNSLRSDILPVIALGGTAIYIPHPLTWAHEDVPVPDQVRGKYIELEHLGLLPAWVEATTNASHYASGDTVE